MEEFSDNKPHYEFPKIVLQIFVLDFLSIKVKEGVEFTVVPQRKVFLGLHLAWLSY